MESSNQDDYSLNSSIDQEVDHQEQEQEQEQEYYMGGVGRSYECVFCKGGFNTAQALGGHMNIHRKDKLATRNKPNTTTHNLLSSTTNKHEIHNLSSGPPRCTGSNLRCYNVAEAQSTYFPSSTSTKDQIFFNQNRNISYSSHDDHHNIQCLNLFGDDWGLQFGKGIETMENKGQENDLDLELRLGHYPLKQ